MYQGKTARINIQLVQQCLHLAADEGLKNYRDQITILVNSNKPFTDKQLQEFHAKAMHEILQTFHETFSPLKFNPESRIIFQNGIENLVKAINWQLPKTLKQYEENIDKITGPVEYCSNYSKNHYYNLMMGFVPSEATKSEILAKHEEAKSEALSKFTEVLRKEGLQIQNDWIMELLGELEERLAIMMEECLETSCIPPGKEEQMKEQQNNVSEWFTNYFESSLLEPTKNISHTSLPSGSKTLLQDPITNDQQPGRSNSVRTDHKIIDSHECDLTSPIAPLNSTDNNHAISEPTLTLVYPDFVGGKEETIQDVSNLTEPNKKPVRYLDVGVYFDKTSVTVGRIHPESFQLVVLMKTSPQIAFHENSVEIGEDAGKYKSQRNHIHIFDASVSGTFTITVNSEQPIRLNWENALTAFFLKLRMDLLTQTGHQSIRNAVITIPYATTSIERRSIQMAAKSAFEKVRVVSSILSTAVTYAANSQFYMQEEKDQKTHSVFVAQSVRKEFVMAAVEVGPNKIATKSIITSKNLPECSNYEYINSHLKLFKGGKLDDDKTKKIYNIYRHAAQQLFDSVVNGNKCAEHALFIRSSKNLYRFYNSIFQDQVLNYFEVNEGPLFGACILAGRLHPSTYRLPPNIPICDKSWTTFSIDFGPAEGSVQTPTSFSYNGPEIVEFNKSPIAEREVHLPPFELGKDVSRVVLSETFQSCEMPLEVDAHYFLDGTDGAEGKVGIIGLKCDEDGVVKLLVDEVSINP